MNKKKIENILKKHNYNFFHKLITKSTMHDVRNYIEYNKKNCIYLSNQQSEGKGQRGNVWDSPIGNIYLSISFDNFLMIKDHFLFSILISSTIKMSLEEFGAKNIYFKWPNDIFYKKKKFAGILTEIINTEENKSYIIIFLGINFISSPQPNNYDATYIKSFCKIESINDFLLVFIKILFLNLEKLQKVEKNSLIKYFKESLMFIDNNVCIILPDKSLKKGILRGINNDGSLKIDIEGRLENIYN